MINFKTPKSLLDAYTNGLVGAYCDKDDLDRLLGDMKHPLFGVTAHRLYGTGKGKISLPFKALLKFDPGFGPAEKQLRGDCVSHGGRNAVDVSRSVEIVNGEREEFLFRGATEGIYGVRGHSGEGMTCGQATRFLTQQGGLVLRKPYGEYDLSTYGKYDFGRSGVPQVIIDEAKKYQVKTASLVRNTEEARDALYNGYAINCCSMQGFSSTRDKYGIAAAQGRWAHAMAVIGCDDSHEIHKECLFLIQNSWGMWNGGPKRLGQPDGSFWIREEIMDRMLKQDGSFVFSNIDGYEARKINWTIDEVF